MKNLEKYLLCFIFGIVLYYIINMMCNCNNGFSIGILAAEYEDCKKDDDCDDGLACKEHLDTPDTICYDMSKAPQGVTECYFLIPFTDREKQLDEQIKLVIEYGKQAESVPAAVAIQNFYTYYRILTFFKLCIDKYSQAGREISNIGSSLDTKKQREKVSNFVKNIISLYAILKIILFDEVAVPDGTPPLPHQFYYFSNYAEARDSTDPELFVNPADKIRPIIEEFNPGVGRKNKFEQRFTNKFTWGNNEEMISLADKINEFLKDIVTTGTDENSAFISLQPAVQVEIGAHFYQPIITILINIDKCLGRKYGTAPAPAVSTIAQPLGAPTGVQSFYYPKVKNDGDECEHDFECMSMNCKDGTCNSPSNPGLNLGEYCIPSFINDQSQQCNNIAHFAPMVKPDLLNNINASCILMDPYGGIIIYARAPQGENTRPDDENRLGNCLIDITDEKIFDEIYSRLPIFVDSLEDEKLRPDCLSVEELKEITVRESAARIKEEQDAGVSVPPSDMEEIFTGVKIGPLIKSVTVGGIFKASGNEYSLVWLKYNKINNTIELHDLPDMGQEPNEIYRLNADQFMESAKTDKKFKPIKTNTFVKQANQWPMSTVDLSPINMCELQRLEGPLNRPLETENPPDNYDEPYGRFMYYKEHDPVIKLYSLGKRVDKFVQHTAYPDKFLQMWIFFHRILSTYKDFFGMFQISGMGGYTERFIYYNKRSNTIESSQVKVSINTEETLDSLIDINDINNIYIYDKLSLTAGYSFFNSEEQAYEKQLLDRRLAGVEVVRGDGTIYNVDSIELYKKWLIDVLYEKKMDHIVQKGDHRSDSQKNNVQFSHYIKIQLNNGEFKIFKTGGTGNTQIGSIFIRNKFAIYLHDIVVNLNQAAQVGGGAAGSMPNFFIGDPEDEEFSKKRPPYIKINLINKELHKALYGTYFMP